MTVTSNHPPFPKCKCQCVLYSLMMTQVRANRAAAMRKRRYFWPPMSVKVAEGVIKNAMKKCIHRHPKHPDQRSLRPPKLLLTKSAISPAADVRNGHRWFHWNHHENMDLWTPPYTLIRGPWGHGHHFDTHTLFPAKSIGLIEPLPLGIVVICSIVIFSRGRLFMTFTLSMVQKKIIYWLIRPQLST